MVKKKIKKGFLKERLVSKPTAKIPSVNPNKFITSGKGNRALVKEGRTGYFNEEMMEEAKWLR